MTDVVPLLEKINAMLDSIEQKQEDLRLSTEVIFDKLFNMIQ